jgi:hypothetical protein
MNVPFSMNLPTSMNLPSFNGYPVGRKVFLCDGERWSKYSGRKKKRILLYRQSRAEWSVQPRGLSAHTKQSRLLSNGNPTTKPNHQNRKNEPLKHSTVTRIYSTKSTNPPRKKSEFPNHPAPVLYIRSRQTAFDFVREGGE